MLDNYFKDELGVVHQKEITDSVMYDEKYIKDRYFLYQEKCVNMSYLRLGFLIGTIGHIPNSILDVGYGSGDFLNVCKNIIPNCYGNDVTGISVPTGVNFVDNIFKNKYEVICFFDVLEHFSDIDIINKLQCDYIFISVPWCHYYNDEWFKNWKHRRPNEHLHHFNDVSLINFFKKHQFELMGISSLEDTIRQSGEKNILSAVFKKI